MNRPFKPHCPAAAPIVPANNGAAATPHGTPLANQRAEGEAGGRSPVPSVSPVYPCRHCEGAGEAEYMGLTEDRYHWRQCHVCEGTGQEAPYCDVCEGKLTADLYCVSCDDWASLTYVERISPTRIAL